LYLAFGAPRVLAAKRVKVVGPANWGIELLQQLLLVSRAPSSSWQHGRRTSPATATSLPSTSLTPGMELIAKAKSRLGVTLGLGAGRVEKG
jgi:hypothetical protein